VRLRRTAATWVRGLLAPGVIALAAACDGGDAPAAPADDVVRVMLTPQAVRLDADDSLDFTAVAYTTGDAIATTTITWSATGGDVIAAGAAEGRHTGHFRAGRACGDQLVVATARPGGQADTAAVTVVCATLVTSVVVTPPAPTLAVGGLLGLTATPRDSAGNPLLGLAVTWTSDAPSVAVVNGAGVVLGVGPGTAHITATVGGTNGVSVVTVTFAAADTRGAWPGDPTAPRPPLAWEPVALTREGGHVGIADGNNAHRAVSSRWWGRRGGEVAAEADSYSWALAPAGSRAGDDDTHDAPAARPEGDRIG